MSSTAAETSRGLTSDRWLRIANMAYWLLLAAGCGVFLLMNFYTTLKEDDLFHSMIGGGSGRPINNLLDVLRSWVEYYRYDARTANLISFTFNGILGKTVFNICNTVVFGVLAHLLSRLCTGRNSVLVLVMFFTYMVTAMPVPGETLLWVTASFNYMWALTASLLFIAYLLWHRNPHPGWARGVLVLVLSLFAGGMNEGTTFGIFGGLALYYLFNRDKVDRAVALAMTGYLLGVLLLITCPGAWDRASMEVSHQAGVLTMIIERCRLIASKSLRYVTPVGAILLGLTVVFKDGIKKTFQSTPWPWILLVMLAFVFVLGQDHPRVYFTLSMIGFIVVTRVVHRLLERWLWLRLAVIVVGLALCLKCYPANISTMKQYQAFFDATEAEITSSSQPQVILKARTFDSYSRFIKYFNFDSWNFFIREETLCYHYGKDNIQFVPDSVYERYHSDRLLDGAVAMPMDAPGCADVEAVLGIPGQEYLAVKMRQDTISHSYQFAQAYHADGTPAALPVCYFPVLYHGHEYLVFPIIDDKVARLTFSPYALDGKEISLVRTSPNPDLSK